MKNDERKIKITFDFYKYIKLDNMNIMNNMNKEINEAYNKLYEIDLTTKQKYDDIDVTQVNLLKLHYITFSDITDKNAFILAAKKFIDELILEEDNEAYSYKSFLEYLKTLYNYYQNDNTYGNPLVLRLLASLDSSKKHIIKTTLIKYIKKVLKITQITQIKTKKNKKRDLPDLTTNVIKLYHDIVQIFSTKDAHEMFIGMSKNKVSVELTDYLIGSLDDKTEYRYYFSGDDLDFALNTWDIFNDKQNILEKIEKYYLKDILAFWGLCVKQNIVVKL